MTCRRSNDGLCADPHYCATTDRCWLDDRGRSFADTKMKGTSATQQRYDDGPVCGRCRHSDFQPSDLPYWNLEPPTAEQGIRAANEAYRIAVCPAIRRRITATSGKGCRFYSPDPAKALK